MYLTTARSVKRMCECHAVYNHSMYPSQEKTGFLEGDLELELTTEISEDSHELKLSSSNSAFFSASGVQEYNYND